MKIPYYISVAASALCLVMSVILFWVGSINQGLQNDVQKQQAKLQKQQEEINKGNAIAKDVGPALLRDMAMSSTKNEKMKELLSAHGYTVNLATPTPAPRAPASTSAEPARLQP